MQRYDINTEMARIEEDAEGEYVKFSDIKAIRLLVKALEKLNFSRPEGRICLCPEYQELKKRLGVK